MSKIKDFKNRQQLKDEEINYLLADVEKNLEEYKNPLEIKEKQLSEAKKILISAKQSYDKKSGWKRRLKGIYWKFKTTHSRTAISIFRKTKNYYHYKKATPKKYKKVACEEESESEPESEEIEKPREIKKASSKKESTNNIFDYINEKNAKRYKQ